MIAKWGSGIYRSSSPENSTFLLFRLWNKDDSTKVNKMASKELFDAAAFLHSEDLVDEEEFMFLAKTVKRITSVSLLEVSSIYVGGNE